MRISPKGIAIRFAGGDGKGQTLPVVARIVGFGAQAAQGRPIVYEMVVPAGGEAQQDLPQGLYNVQLTLPSGRIIQRNVTIDEDSNETYAYFEDFAPSSGFSLQESVGKQQPVALDVATAASGNTSSEDYESALKRGLSIDSSLKGLGKLRYIRNPPLRDPPTPPRQARLAVHVGAEPDLDAAPAWGDPDIVCTELKGDAALWRIVRASHAPPTKAERRWARIKLPDGGTEVASLPLPWYSIGSSQFAPAVLLVDPARSEGASTMVAVHDERLAGLLAYLDQGQAGSARPLLRELEDEQIIEMTIGYKGANPLAACAAAYVGLAVYDPREKEVWDHWLRNCMERFPAIPDAAIVHARRLILRPTGKDDNDRAADALRRACEAGIPYFSTGVGLLGEMLTLLSPDHTDLAPLAARAAQLASRVDPSQAFTVLRYAPPPPERRAID
jgi:hypothetical protein